MYVCLTLCFYAIIPALLHTAMPTPCLNAFWHSGPYIFSYFVGNFFLSRFCDFFLGHLSSMKTDTSTQQLPTENSGEFDSLQLLVA